MINRVARDGKKRFPRVNKRKSGNASRLYSQPLSALLAMPRKAAAAAATEDVPAPRRSSRIKEQPQKLESTKKTPKPKAKKANKEPAEKEDKPKSSRGTKRKAEDEPNGADAPSSKKVSLPFSMLFRFSDILR